MPIAVPRWRAGNVAEMIESVAGFMSAAPAPCTTRAPIRKPALGASAQASEEAAEDRQADDEHAPAPEQVGQLSRL